MERFRNESGVTLVEILAVLTIASFIMTLIMGIHIFIQKQYNSQSKDAKQLTDVTIVAKVITQDIRKYDVEEATGRKIVFKDGPTYELIEDKNVITRDGSDYVYEVETFNVKKTGEKIMLQIVSKSGKEIATEIFIR